MIFYFSGTGNSRWLANQLATLLDDQVFDIMTVDVASIVFRDKETIGFVFPIYAWGVPQVMNHFIQRLQKALPTIRHHFLYALASCGENTGNALIKLEKLLPIQSAYSVAMPNNFVIGSDVDNAAVIAKKMADAKEQLTQIARDIQTKKQVSSFVKGSFPALKTALVAPLMAGNAHRIGKRFSSDENCIGCGLCVEYCQFNNIKMVNNRPKWSNMCNLCMACINRCPQQAIQYGKGTKKRGRYYLDV